MWHLWEWKAPTCPFSISCVLPSVHVCLPLSVSVFSSVVPPLVISPGLLPPLSPHLFLVSSLVSVYLVSAFPRVFVRSLVLFLLLLVWCPSRVPSVSRMIMHTCMYIIFLIIQSLLPFFCIFFTLICSSCNTISHRWLITYLILIYYEVSCPCLKLN